MFRRDSHSRTFTLSWQFGTTRIYDGMQLAIHPCVTNVWRNSDHCDSRHLHTFPCIVILTRIVKGKAYSVPPFVFCSTLFALIFGSRSELRVSIAYICGGSFTAILDPACLLHPACSKPWVLLVEVDHTSTLWFIIRLRVLRSHVLALHPSPLHDLVTRTNQPDSKPYIVR